MSEQNTNNDILTLTADIVAAHVTNNEVAAEALPGLIREVYQALVSVDAPAEETVELVPAVSVKQSIKPDYLVCLEDGKKLKMLRRHLKTAYNMTPEEYRARWNLPADYPMVAPNYAKQRSALAKKIGLGKKTTTRKKK